MKCTNKLFSCFLIGCVLAGSLTGCGQDTYSMTYDRNASVSSFRFSTVDDSGVAKSFASDLCVTEGNVSEGTDVALEEGNASILCDLNNRKVIYAKAVHDQMEPASLTKVMTALVALKYGNLDDVLTASSNVNIGESGASVVGLKAGDTMTLDQALHALLMPSGNDAAVLIAENIGGSVEGFAQMMNDEAKAIGATNCNFVNPHGLTAESHYVTAYDMYLIFAEAIKYDKFTEIINLDSYSTVYYDAQGKPKELTCKTTNLFLKGTYTAPDHITVIGGKTGTTNSAQNCLVILAKDTSGNPYVAVILKCSERGILYQEMTDLLTEINN